MADTIIVADAPDFSFIIVENTSNRPDIKAVSYDSAHARLRSVGEIHTILGMHELMSKSLEILAPIGSPQPGPNNIPTYSSSGIFFAPDFPDFLLPKTNLLYHAAPAAMPVAITWGNVRKEPGTVSGTPFRGTQEIKPRFREYVAVFTDYAKRWVIGDTESSLEGYGERYAWVKTKAQAFDNLVQYNIWAKSNYEVERWTQWFEDYMESYRGMFREAGIVELVFNRRVRDDTLIQMNNGYHLRSVLYYVRTERVRIESISPIKRIDLKIQLNDLKSVTDNLQDHTIDANLYERILKRWHQ